MKQTRVMSDEEVDALGKQFVLQADNIIGEVMNYAREQIATGLLTAFVAGQESVAAKEAGVGARSFHRAGEEWDGDAKSSRDQQARG